MSDNIVIPQSGGGPTDNVGNFSSSTAGTAAVTASATGATSNGVHGLASSNDVVLTGADCAEEFDIAQAAEADPGTVMVLGQDGILQQCQQAYDKRVAGVISGAGDYRPGMILDRQQSQDNRIAVALVGKVY